MLSDFNGADRVYLAVGYTDLRKGIDGLATLVQQQFELDPFTNTLFLFCGRRRDRMKALYWEKDGFLLLYKRLEEGSFHWPRSGGDQPAHPPEKHRLPGVLGVFSARSLFVLRDCDGPKQGIPFRVCRPI